MSGTIIGTVLYILLVFISHKCLRAIEALQILGGVLVTTGAELAYNPEKEPLEAN